MAELGVDRRGWVSWFRVGVLVVAVMLATAACSGDARDELLPPPTVDRLAPILDPLVADLGLKTTRASLLDPLDPTYEGNPEGTHLAMYVAPNEDITFEAFQDNFLPLARIIVPYVFERWPDLESFDICQESYEWSGDKEVAPSVTLLFVKREKVQSIDWEKVSVSDLFEVAEHANFGIDPKVSEDSE